jgi:tetratricopeptide (TPR) repeat protein
MNSANGWRILISAFIAAIAILTTLSFWKFQVRPGTQIQAAPGSRPGPAHELSVLADALAKNPDHAPVLMQMALLESSRGDYRDAEGRLRRILEIEPANLEARLELGRVLFQAGDIAGALDQTKGVLEHQPTHPDALYNLGAIYANIGNRERAGDCWTRLLAVRPDSESARLAKQSLARLQSRIH